MVVATSARWPLKQALILCYHWGSEASAHVTKVLPPHALVPNLQRTNFPDWKIRRVFFHLPSSCFFHCQRCCHWRPRPQVVSTAMASWFQICCQQMWVCFLDEKRGGLNGAGGLLMLGDTSPEQNGGFCGEPGLAFSVRVILWGHDRLDLLEIPKDFGAPPVEFRDWTRGEYGIVNELRKD